MSNEERRSLIQKALMAAVEGARVSTLAAAASQLEEGKDELQVEKTASFMMRPFPRSRFRGV